MSRDLKELFILMYKLLRENKFADVAILNSKCMKSISAFNNVDEMMNYAESTYSDSIIIKKNGSKKYTEQIYFHQFNGFKLNEKSVTILTNVYTGAGSRAGYRKNIRF